MSSEAEHAPAPKFIDPDRLPPPPAWNHPLYAWYVVGAFAVTALVLMAYLFPNYQVFSRARHIDRLLEAEDYAVAAPLLEYLTRQEPRAWLRLSQLGDCYRMLNRPAEALEKYNAALSVNPGLDLAAQRGYALSDLGRYSDASMLFEHVLASNPQHPGVNFYLGRVRMAQGKWLEAAKCLQAAAADPVWNKRAEPLRKEIAQRILNPETAKPASQG